VVMVVMGIRGGSGAGCESARARACERARVVGAVLVNEARGEQLRLALASCTSPRHAPAAVKERARRGIGGAPPSGRRWRALKQICLSLRTPSH
jgi:hypothetical protein